MATISKQAYAGLPGPRGRPRAPGRYRPGHRSGETDHTLKAGGYGEEVKFGGGKPSATAGQSSTPSRQPGAVDTVMTNAPSSSTTGGIVKADIGLKDHRIVAIGKAGNPTPAGRGHHHRPRHRNHQLRRQIVTAGGAWTAISTSFARSRSKRH